MGSGKPGEHNHRPFKFELRPETLTETRKGQILEMLQLHPDSYVTRDYVVQKYPGIYRTSITNATLTIPLAALKKDGKIRVVKFEGRREALGLRETVFDLDKVLDIDRPPALSRDQLAIGYQDKVMVWLEGEDPDKVVSIYQVMYQTGLKEKPARIALDALTKQRRLLYANVTGSDFWTLNTRYIYRKRVMNCFKGESSSHLSIERIRPITDLDDTTLKQTLEKLVATEMLEVTERNGERLWTLTKKGGESYYLFS